MIYYFSVFTLFSPLPDIAIDYARYCHAQLPIFSLFR
jgi:hypothetical protein